MLVIYVLYVDIPLSKVSGGLTLLFVSSDSHPLWLVSFCVCFSLLTKSYLPYFYLC